MVVVAATVLVVAAVVSSRCGNVILFVVVASMGSIVSSYSMCLVTFGVIVVVLADSIFSSEDVFDSVESSSVISLDTWTVSVVSLDSYDSQVSVVTFRSSCSVVLDRGVVSPTVISIFVVSMPVTHVVPAVDIFLSSSRYDFVVFAVVESRIFGTLKEISTARLDSFVVCMGTRHSSANSAPFNVTCLRKSPMSALISGFTNLHCSTVCRPIRRQALGALHRISTGTSLVSHRLFLI